MKLFPRLTVDEARHGDIRDCIDPETHGNPTAEGGSTAPLDVVILIPAIGASLRRAGMCEE
jgi:hypothetical protein